MVPFVRVAAISLSSQLAKERAMDQRTRPAEVANLYANG
jgi:hypothetical protein